MMPDAIKVGVTPEGKQYLQVLVHTEKNPKQPIRFCYIPQAKEEWLFREILRWHHGRPKDIPLFTRKEGKKKKANGIGKRTAELICKKWLGFHPHALRHIRTTTMLSGEAWGVPIPISVIQQLGGWGNIQSLQRYAHLDALAVAQKFW